MYSLLQEARCGRFEVMIKKMNEELSQIRIG
jgi:hypothetical protein